MKASIDFSIFTRKEGAFGNVSGEISVSTPPQIGDSISFLFPKNGLSIDPSIGFSGDLKAADRIISVNRDDQTLIFALSDVTLETKNEALRLAEHFECCF